MRVGTGDYQYEVITGWARLPAGWSFGWIPSVAVDSRDRVYVYSRSEHPMMVFDREGGFLTSWGDEVLKDAHGIFIDQDDNIYCTERLTHCVHKFTSEGELQWTLGSPGVPRPPGVPFNLPTDLAIAPDGCFFVSDGYGNFKVHKYSPQGVLLSNWGEPGSGPGQFNLVHSVWVDSDYQIYICDRENNRIQIFDGDGKFLREWPGFLQPDKLWFDRDETIYMAEIGHRVTILSREGKILSQWGEAGEQPHQFRSFPHGIWGDSRGDLYVSEVGSDAQLKKFVRVRS
jgi:DNA-binding beta-propeller fold protein YncE